MFGSKIFGGAHHVLFGFGIGNATSLPPLIAQAEFAQPVELIEAGDSRTHHDGIKLGRF